MNTAFGVWLPQVHVIRCERFDDAMVAAQALQERQCVVLQLDGMDPLQAQRLVDFVAGAVQALEGRIERIGEGTVLCAPAGVEVGRS